MSQPAEDDSFVPSCGLVFRRDSGGGVRMGVCISSSRRRCALFGDDKTLKLSFFEFQDTEQAGNLESVLVRMCPQRVHYPELDSEDSRTLKHKLTSTLDGLNVESKPCKAKPATGDVIQADLEGLLGGEIETKPLAMKIVAPEWKLAFQAMSLLCQKEGYLARGEEYRGQFVVEFSSLEEFVRLDSASTTALNLLPSREDRNKESSLLGVLDRTVTKKLGTRLMTKWIRHPLVNENEITKRHDRVQVLMQDIENREALRSALKAVPDLDQIAKRFMAAKRNASGAVGGLEDLYQLYRFTEALPSLVGTLETLVENARGQFGGHGQEDDDTATIATPAQPSIPFESEWRRAGDLLNKGKFGQYKEFVEQVLDLNSAPREFLIRPEHDDSGELLRLTDERAEIERAIEKLQKKIMASSDMQGMDLKIETDSKMLRTHGHHFRVSKKHDAELKTVKPGMYLAVVQSCIRWSTPTLKDFSEKRQQIVAEQRSLQVKLVQEAMLVASSYLPVVEMSAQLVSELDVFASFAHVAATSPNGDYVRPEMTGKQGDLYLPSARHPCLELQPGISFVANTHDMKRDKSRFQILTGPNMGGKSTFARQLGVLCVMAQIGSFVPCAPGARVPVVDSVLARVGASDAQLRGISTFMAEMIEASNIVKSCTDSSLIIIDELGRGTSTYDGFGLAWAISEFLAKDRKSLCVFATHFHELTELENVLPGVCNLHVAASVQPDGKIVMLHEVRNGRCDESFGVNIARIAGFPLDVIEDASEKLKRLDRFKGFDPLLQAGGVAEEDDDEYVSKKIKLLVEEESVFAEDDAGFVGKIKEDFAV